MEALSPEYSPIFNTGLNSWTSLWQKLGGRVPAVTLHQKLMSAYREPWRRYHTLVHLEACLIALSEVRQLCCHPEEVAIALWFHDAIYDPRQGNNEEQSAQWAEQAAQECGIRPTVAHRIRELILATKHHELPQDQDAQILVDIDLSILGASEERFNAYELQVRQEYDWVSEIEFKAGRQRILETLCSRPVIYGTANFRDSLEKQARSNLRRSLMRLKKS